MLATLAGTALVIASACVFNNYIDRGIDKNMARTKKRALVTGSISGRSALVYACALGFAGFTLLVLFVNLLTAIIGLVAFVDYIVFYGLSKRRSVHGTIVGSISGSAPIVAGYTAVTNRFDGAALILFLIMTFWQMPHFYGIAMYRYKDYKTARLPVLPVKRGYRAAKIQSLFYVAAFLAAIIALTFFGHAGYTFLIVMAALTLWWLGKGIKNFNRPEDKAWGRQMFLFSLIVLLSMSVMLSVNALVP